MSLYYTLMHQTAPSECVPLDEPRGSRSPGRDAPLSFAKTPFGGQEVDLSPLIRRRSLLAQVRAHLGFPPAGEPDKPHGVLAKDRLSRLVASPCCARAPTRPVCRCPNLTWNWVVCHLLLDEMNTAMILRLILTQKDPRAPFTFYHPKAFGHWVPFSVRFLGRHRGRFLPRPPAGGR